MSKIRYVKRRFARRNLDLINNVNKIIKLYKHHGMKPTTSKIYNKMVKAGELEDTQRDYKRLVSTIGHARKAGLIGWDDIEGKRQKHERDREL